MQQTSTDDNDQTFELEARGHWALAMLAEFVNQGRAAGWIPGEPVPQPRSPDVFRSIGQASETPMRHLERALGLSQVAVDVLWFLACIELEPRIARAAQLVMSPGMVDLDAQLIERIVMRGDVFVEDVLTQLADACLIELVRDPRTPAYRRPVRVCDRVLDLARGRLDLDPELAAVASITEVIDMGRRPQPMAPAVASPALAAVAAARRALIVAQGVSGSGRATLLRHAAAYRGLGTLSIRTSALAPEAPAVARQLRAIVRECRLHGVIPLFMELDADTERLAMIERELLVRWDGPVLATTRQPLRWTSSWPLIAVETSMPDTDARAQLWRQVLQETSAEVVTRSAERYRIPPRLIAQAGAAVTAVVASCDVADADVHQSIRTLLDRHLQGLARRIETRQTWNDLVLPVEQLETLIELVARVRHRDLVLDHWGFGDKVGRGTGLATLLSGPPGTGKTMIAGLLAQELGLDLYQVDLSSIVSKYIGETEKQLASLFDAAEAGHVVLLFDEADSLFAKRTEVKSSNDRYANLEVNYLLQRMESFTGISILTTNHEMAVDPAFMRRLAFHVRVPMPDVQQRTQIWKSMIPTRAATGNDLAFEELAGQFVMSGGYIRNAVLRAAFLAAEAGEPIGNAHLRRAARSEYESMGKVAFAPASRHAL